MLVWGGSGMKTENGAVEIVTTSFVILNRYERPSLSLAKVSPPTPRHTTLPSAYSTSSSQTDH